MASGGLTDEDVFGPGAFSQASAPVPQATVAAPGPISVQPLPNLPGYVSDPTYVAPKGQANNPTWQAPAVPLGGAEAQGGMTDAQVFGAPGPGNTGAPRPASNTLGFMEGVATPLKNFNDFSDATLGSLPLVGGLFHTNATDAKARAGTDQYFAQREQTQRPGVVGKVVGNMAATAPFVAGLGPMAGGALSGALTSESKTPQGRAFDTVMGLLGGKAADVGLTAAQSIVAPVVRPAAQWAAENGIRLTPGAILGGAGPKVEQGLSRLSLVGPFVRNGQIRTIEDFNHATLNNALAPAGLSLPAGVPAGHEAIDAAHQALSGAYNDLLPNLTITRDQPFEIPAASELTGTYKTKFDKLLKDQVMGKFKPGPDGAMQMSGQTMKGVDDLLGAQARRFGKAPDPLANEYGDAVAQLQSELRDMTERTNPAYADKLGALNSGWAQLVRAEKAGSLAAQRGGVFTPDDLISAAKTTDSSTRGSATARGRALLQDWANQAKAVVPAKMPAGGSPLDHMVEGLVALGVGKEAGMPVVAKAAALEGVLAALYSKGAQPGVTAALTKRPALAPQIAAQMEKLRPLLQAAGGSQGPVIANNLGLEQQFPPAP